MLFPPHGPEDGERIHSKVEEEEEEEVGRPLGGHRDVQNGILQSDGNPRHILQHKLLVICQVGRMGYLT